MRRLWVLLMLALAGCQIPIDPPSTPMHYRYLMAYNDLDHRVLIQIGPKWDQDGLRVAAYASDLGACANNVCFQETPYEIHERHDYGVAPCGNDWCTYLDGRVFTRWHIRIDNPKLEAAPPAWGPDGELTTQ